MSHDTGSHTLRKQQCNITRIYRKTSFRVGFQFLNYNGLISSLKLE
uniref:Uncharacterized protein n=1 Tax=Arundo donax TaxID=35708 RepID=A0A0A8YQJ8_ARUDO